MTNYSLVFQKLTNLIFIQLLRARDQNDQSNTVPESWGLVDGFKRGRESRAEACR